MDGDRDFTEYVAARWSSLVRAAVLLGCPYAEAEDLTQTALARCYVSWARVSRADNRDAYVYRTLVNCWAKGRRRRWRGEEPTAETPDVPVSDGTERLALQQDLLTALRQLSEEFRVVLVLRYVADLTVPEVAAVLQVPLGTAKSRISRALAAIRLTDILEEIP